MTTSPGVRRRSKTIQPPYPSTSALLKWLRALCRNRPPLAERIRAIDPSFHGAFPPVAFADVDRVPPRVSPPPQRSLLPFPFPGLPRAHAGVAGLAPPVIAAQARVD